MAHFAELDQKNTVLRVIVISNNQITDENGVESEDKGIAFCQNLFGENTVWKQTSYNSNFRKKYAAIGDSYSEKYDAFISPKPFPSWNFNETDLAWDPPVPKPDGVWSWDEGSLSWVEASYDGTV